MELLHGPRCSDGSATCQEHAGHLLYCCCRYMATSMPDYTPSGFAWIKPLEWTKSIENTINNAFHPGGWLGQCEAQAVLRSWSLQLLFIKSNPGSQPLPQCTPQPGCSLSFFHVHWKRHYISNACRGSLPVLATRGGGPWCKDLHRCQPVLRERIRSTFRSPIPDFLLPQLSWDHHHATRHCGLFGLGKEQDTMQPSPGLLCRLQV